MCSDWSALWSLLQRSSPRQLWSKYRQFTNQRSEDATCTPDEQWCHWATQGDTIEAVWNDSLSGPASEWTDLLQGENVQVANPQASMDEVRLAGERLRPGRACGVDGIPSEVITKVSGLLPVITLLFSIMLQFAVYPKVFGVALIRAILKPGKPRNLPSSLRGIRLICSIASWFGQVLDQRARTAWQAGPSQFGFRAGLGCSEAVATIMALIYSRTSKGKRFFVLFVDLRTAFPSINRAILLHRLFQCGLSVAFCKLLLTIFDMTTSVLCIDNLVGESFQETLGTREGAVESPHLFNVYIDGLRNRLEIQHQRLCKLLNITIAVILYADDAVLPADSPEDLEASAKIFEEFCNDMRLYISVGKTYLMVFHNSDDDQVKYQDGTVWVDGRQISIKIYDTTISAAKSFKYLGVMLDSSCGHTAHFESWYAATQRAGISLNAGILRIPAAPHDFVRYLYGALVSPVAQYGAELFVWDVTEETRFKRLLAGLWRRMLKVGGRTPHDVTALLMGAQCCTIEWRIRRVGLLLRLLNSPPDSWQHVALTSLMLSSSPWYCVALSDLQIVLPTVTLKVGVRDDATYLYSTRSWHNGEIHSAQPHGLRYNSAGHQSCTYMAHGPQREEIRMIQKHTRDITRRLRTLLTLEAESERKTRLLEQRSGSLFCKAVMSANILCSPGPAPPTALAWVGTPGHAAALAAFFAGDFFLARYAGNYFAKKLIPSRPCHMSRLTSLGLEGSRVCLHCWHCDRSLHLEDEAHMVTSCGLYRGQRSDLLNELTESASVSYSSAGSQDGKLAALISSIAPQDWRAFGKFLSRARQLRRKMRTSMQRRYADSERRSFESCKPKWKREGKYVCRHGVFYEVQVACACLDLSSEADWSSAVLMPVIDEALKDITVDTFDPHSFQRLGQLRAELRRRGW